MILKQKIKGFFDTKNSNVETKSDKASIWLNLNKSKYLDLTSFPRKYFSAPLSSVYSERLFSEAGNLYEQKRYRLLPKTGKKLTFISPAYLEKTRIAFCSITKTSFAIVVRFIFLNSCLS